jgi:hypothetical protein
LALALVLLLPSIATVFILGGISMPMSSMSVSIIHFIINNFIDISNAQHIIMLMRSVAETPKFIVDYGANFASKLQEYKRLATERRQVS